MDKLLEYLNPDDKHERCGLILNDGQIIEVDNIHGDPEHGFEIPAEMLVRHEKKLSGTWHTHPNGTSQYSQMDHLGFSQWPQLTHFIISPAGVIGYKVVNGSVVYAD